MPLQSSLCPAGVSDVELLHRIQRGEGVAPIGLLYDRYARVLLPIALRILRDGSEAEDIVHDAFVVVGARARHYTADHGPVAAWITTIVRNLSIDRTRLRDRRGAIICEALPHEPVDEVADPERLLLNAMEQDTVRCAMQDLSCAHRKTLENAFFEDLNYSEMAERDSVPLGTIKSRAARALASLRDACARHGLTESGT
jgi:RNA polymerase sigma-70 factor, ECF subfamily